MTTERPDSGPQLVQLNAVAHDLDATVAFYRRLGLPVADDGEPAGARHIEIAMGNGFSLELDNVASASAWNAGVRADQAPTTVLGFSLPSRDAVDETFAALVAGGAIARQEPHDAFWGGRYAVVADPDGRDVGLIGPRGLSNLGTGTATGG